jgi:hypothetical protein
MATVVALKERGDRFGRRARGSGSQRRVRDVGSLEARTPDWRPLASHLRRRRWPSLGTFDDDGLP